jgi:hypothetical protein
MEMLEEEVGASDGPAKAGHQLKPATPAKAGLNTG